jgi:hypothetical protein
MNNKFISFFMTKRSRDEAGDHYELTAEDADNIREITAFLKEKRQRLRFKDSNNTSPDEGGDSIFGNISWLFRAPPTPPESLIIKHLGDKIHRGDVEVVSTSPYDDAGTLTEYIFHLQYPNFITLEEALDIKKYIPGWYNTVVDLETCKPGQMRIYVQSCESESLRRILDKEALQKPSDSSSSTDSSDPNISMKEGAQPNNNNNNSAPGGGGGKPMEVADMLNKRIRDIFKFVPLPLSQLPPSSEKTAHNLPIAVIHRFVVPPITDSAIYKLHETPLIVRGRLAPEKDMLRIRLTLEITKS